MAAVVSTLQCPSNLATPHPLPFLGLRAAVYMLLAGPFLLPRGAGVKGAKKLYRRLRRRGGEEGELITARLAAVLWPAFLPLKRVTAAVPAAHAVTAAAWPACLKAPPTACIAAEEEVEETSNDFFVGLLVGPGSPVAGQTIARAGLVHLDGLTLVSVKCVLLGPVAARVLGLAQLGGSFGLLWAPSFGVCQKTNRVAGLCRQPCACTVPIPAPTNDALDTRLNPPFRVQAPRPGAPRRGRRVPAG